jgi:hypothetical protein
MPHTLVVGFIEVVEWKLDLGKIFVRRRGGIRLGSERRSLESGVDQIGAWLPQKRVGLPEDRHVEYRLSGCGNGCPLRAYGRWSR